jgi:DNA-binding NarL/FixJ family response regulator
MKRIVVIDDETMLRENMLEILQLSGYLSFGADSGDKGLELIRTIKPDLILCDIKMPNYDGYWVLEQLKNEISFAYTPFIFVTAKVDQKDIRKGMEMGADDYITKPFTSRELLGSVEARMLRMDQIRAGVFKPEVNSESFTEAFSGFRQQLALLTKSEKEIVLMIAAGFSSSEIAEKRFNSIKTIENHRSNIISKLGLNGHLSLVKFCISIKPMIEMENISI